MYASRRRAAAQAKSRRARIEQRRREMRRTLLVRAGILTGLLAVVTVTALILVTMAQPEVVSPRNFESDGIVIGKDFEAVRSAAPAADAATTPVSAPPSAAPGATAPAAAAPAAAAAAATPAPAAPPAAPGTLSIQLYVDYLCPECGAFEEQNGDYLADLVESGAASLTIHPVAILDGASLGTRYSTRAGAAAVCVGDYAPDSFFAVNAALFRAQPKEQTQGLSNGELATLIGDIPGIPGDERIADCVEDQRFAPWVTEATRRAAAGHFPGTDVRAFQGTPTVVVDGVEWTGGQPFREFVTSVVGQSTP